MNTKQLCGWMRVKSAVLAGGVKVTGNQLNDMLRADAAQYGYRTAVLSGRDMVNKLVALNSEVA